MAKIEIGQKDGYAPKAKVDELVSGQEYPLQVTFTHAHRKALVIPSAKYGENQSIIPPKTPVVFTLNSYQQAWDVFMDIAGLAEIWRSDSFGALVSKAVAAVVPAPAPEPTAVAVAASEVKV